MGVVANPLSEQQLGVAAKAGSGVLLLG